MLLGVLRRSHLQVTPNTRYLFTSKQSSFQSVFFSTLLQRRSTTLSPQHCDGFSFTAQNQSRTPTLAQTEHIDFKGSTKKNSLYSKENFSIYLILDEQGQNRSEGETSCNFHARIHKPSHLLTYPCARTHTHAHTRTHTHHTLTLEPVVPVDASPFLHEPRTSPTRALSTFTRDHSLTHVSLSLGLFRFRVDASTPPPFITSRPERQKKTQHKRAWR